MPTIFFYGPELDDEKKRELIKSFTESASKLTGIDEGAFVVYLRPSSTDNVGVGGELLRDRLERENR
jgi:4-oxalocrotonate tautomerase